MTMKRFNSSLILTTIFLAASCVSGPSMPPREQAVTQPFPVRIVELSGTGTQMGEAHGRQLNEPINFMFDHYL